MKYHEATTGEPARVVETKRMLGHEFERMSDGDRQGFAGMGPRSWWWYDYTTILLYDEDEGTLSELPVDPPEGADHEHRWKFLL